MGFFGSLFGVNAGLQGLGSLLGIGGAALGYKYNKRLMEQQQAWNTSEREAQQKYNTSERISAQNYNTGEREAQNAYAEQMYNTYSSPEALVRQYSGAGLNPRLAIGSNTAGSVAASSGHSATVSPQSSGMLGITPPYQDVSSFSQGFVNIANALKSLADAKKSGVETKRMEAFLQDELKGLQYQNRATELANLFNEKVLARADEKLDLEIKDILTRIANGQLEGKELEQKIKYLESQNVIIKYEGDHWLEKFRAEQDIRKATKEELEAGAAEKRASAQVKIDEHNLFDIKKQLMRSQIGLNLSQAKKEEAVTRYTDSMAALNGLDIIIKTYSGPREGPAWDALSNFAKTTINNYETSSNILQAEQVLKDYEIKQAKYKSDLEHAGEASGILGDTYKTIKALNEDARAAVRRVKAFFND